MKDNDIYLKGIWYEKLGYEMRYENLLNNS